MSKQTNNDRILTLEVKRDMAATRLEVAAKHYRLNAGSLFADIFEMEMDDAFEALTVAGQDLREARDGYRFTHPRACSNPDHANSICSH